MAVEKRGLETGAATGFKMGLAGFGTDFYSRKEIVGQYACSVNGLESVAEGSVHDMNGFLSHVGISWLFIVLII